MYNRFILFCCLLTSLVAGAQPYVANFRSDISGGCSPIVVNFEDLSTGNPALYEWDFGNGATSVRKNPSATFFDEGVYTVRLTVSDANGNNKSTKTGIITVYLQPTVAFSANRTNGCTPARIRFTDASTSPPNTRINSWKWDFGDGGTSTLQNPEYIYRTAGNFTVTLTVGTDKGCTRLLTKPNYIDIIQGTVPSFSFEEPKECSAPATITFNNASTGPPTLSYIWNFGDGGTSTAVNPQYIYRANGSYTVSLVVNSTFGCTDTITRQVDIGKVKTDFTVPGSICPKTPAVFLNASNPLPNRVSWRFSDGKTDSIRNGRNSFATTGTYTVTVINTYNICVDSLTKTVNVTAGPTLNFSTLDTVKCAPPLTANFTNTSNADTYTWDFGDSTTSTSANPSHTYTKFGTFDVTLIGTSANGCRDTLRRREYIRIRKPEISLPGYPKTGCIPYTTTFVPEIKSVDEITSYRWNFGDGGTATGEKPTYTYNRLGTYNVTLTITTRTGCTETYTLNEAIKVGTLPAPDFTSDVTRACANPGIQFINLTPDPKDSLDYRWEFSDGSINTTRNPRHVFLDTGTITVTLTAINNGCENRITKQDYVKVLPSVSRFDYKPDCNNRNLYTFTDKSVGAQTWLWRFSDDNSTFNGPNPPAHTFPGIGTYSVSLTTTNGSCTYTLTREIRIINNTPNFTAVETAGCKPFNVRINPSSPNMGVLKSFTWNFGDGNTSNRPAQDPIGYNQFTNAGNYAITLTTIDTFGCINTITKNNYIRVNGPVAAFTSLNNSGCKGATVTFNDNTITDGTNNIVSWRWDFGDGTIKNFTAPPFQHRYDSLNFYDVTMVVRDRAGCVDSATNRDFVKLSFIKADWSVGAQSCPNAGVSFSNRTGGTNYTYTSLWNFGDGGTDNGNSPTYSYRDTGSYTVQLKVRDELGCEDSLTKANNVYIGVPKASFDANNFTTYCTPFEAKFVNKSTYYSSSFWSFGPGKGTSTQNEPNTYYTITGVYPVKLVVTSPGGCKDSVQQNMNVFNPSDGTMKYGPLVGCRPLPVSFEAFSKMRGTFIWDFGDGNVEEDSIDNKINHVYDNLGSFVPRIILRQPEGCLVPLTGADAIEINGAKAIFRVQQRLFCDSGYLAVRDSTLHLDRDAVTSYTWDYGDGTISNSYTPPPHLYSAPGNYKVTLVVRTASGCADSMTVNPIKVVQSPLISMRGDSVICANDYVQFTGLFDRSDTSAVRWSWQFPNGNRENRQFPSIQQFKTPGSFSVTALAVNSSGCVDSARQSLVVNPIPAITLPPTITIQQGFPITMPATYSSNIATYLWTPATGLNCTDCPQPETLPKMNTMYRVAVVDSNGCRNTKNVQVLVLCKNANVFLPNTFSPNGDGSNDIFYVRGRGLDRVKSLRIFNRWGQVVFEKRDFAVNDPSAGWDGTFRGAKPQADVYVYQLEVYCENSTIIKFDGNVALIQ